MNKGTDISSQTYYKVLGSGEPLILIHGVGDSHMMWKAQMNYFSNYFKTYSYDTIGHGFSEKPNSDSYTLEDYTRQLSQFMDERKIKKANIIGFSMGGMIAQAFSLSHPDRVIKMIITNAVANRTDKERRKVLNRADVVESEGRLAVYNKSLERWYSPGFLKENPSLITEYKKNVEKSDEKSYLKAYRLFATADKKLWGQLNKINLPTLIITGENDIGSTPQMARDMNEKIPNSKLVIVPDVKHQLPIEMPNTFNKHVHEFLNQ